MKLIEIGILVLSLGFALAASAAPGQELFSAAKYGQVPSIQAALKAGADVNSRFDVGKTALMVAAEQGRDAAVEALVDAGADLYMLDNNNWDALAHAAMSLHVSTVNLLLRKGIDPSKNNWRALAVVRSQSGGGMDRRGSSTRLTEVQAILEAAYKRSGTTGTVGALPGSPSAATARVLLQEEMAEPILIDVSERKVTSEIFKSAAARALLQRGWKIIATEPGQITGTLTKDKEYRARISFKPPMIIKIEFIEGYGSRRPNWLVNLKEDLEIELNATLVR